MNNTVKNIKKHTKKLEAVAKKGEELRKALHKTIVDLPDNPAIKRVEQSPRCFTISSSAVFGDAKNNPTFRMDPFFHNFKSQYEVIAQAVDSCDPARTLKTLQNIVETESLKKAGNNYYRFHPQVIRHLRELIGEPAA